MMKDSTSKSSFGEFQDFIEDGSLTISNVPADKPVDKNELEERRLEMLRDNRLEKYNGYSKKTKSKLQQDEIIEEAKHSSYSRPNLKYFLDRSEGYPTAQKNSFKLFQAMTLGDTYDASNMHSFITAGGSKYKPKIFEILKKHSRQSCKLWQTYKGDTKFIHKNLEDKYTTSLEFYNVKIINDIMYNEKVRIVCLFKDYLIFDDLTEFLKRSYTYPEAIIRLSKIYEFYEAYSQVFPNYIRLSARKHMYKNIERKQRLIEAQNDSHTDSSFIEDNESSEKQTQGLVNQKIFNSTFMDSILKSQKKNYAQMNLEGLVNSFLRQSVSHNEISSFLNESNYSIFSKAATKNVTPQKSAIDLLAQEHKNLQTSNKLKALTKENQKSDKEHVKKSTSKKTNYQGYYGAKTLEGKKSDDDFTTK